jgi:CRISPR/Cas system-associated exonuclease Cas4 (RecB family)
MDLIERLHTAMSQKTSAWPRYDGGDLDRTAFLTASENLSCLRKVKFDKLEGRGLESWGYAERGHAVEAWVVDRLEEALQPGEAMKFYGFMQRSFVDDQRRLSGTPDGVLTITKGRRTTTLLLEFKSVDPRTNLEAMDAPKPQHAAQVQQNMHLLRHNDITVSKAIILYIDASNFERMRQFEVAFDRAQAERFALRAASLFATESPAELLPEGLTNGGCTYCTHTEACSRIQIAKKEQAPKQPKPAALPDFAPRGITDTIRAYAAANEAKKEYETKVKDLGEKIKEHAQQSGETALRTANHVALITEVAGRKTLDVAAYAAATGVPAEDYYKTGKPSLRLEVKPVEEE